MEENPAKFFMQVDQNRDKWNLTNPEERLCSAKQCFNNANAFYNLMCAVVDSVLLGVRSLDNLMDTPIFVNQALISELYLKALLLNKDLTKEEINKLHRHELNDLFEMLDEKEQLSIFEFYPKNSGVNDFDTFKVRVKEINKAFVVLRYSHELKRLGVDARFLCLFAATMHDYTNERFRNIEAANEL